MPRIPGTIRSATDASGAVGKPGGRDGALYVSHSGRLYGTERMAIATLEALRSGGFDPALCAPPGEALELALALGIRTHSFDGWAALTHTFATELARHERLVTLTTSVRQAALFETLRVFRHGRTAHLHVVHGGVDEKGSYGHKRWLAGFPVRIVAVSDYVASRLAAHGVPATRIDVAENFIYAERLDALCALPLRERPLRRIVVVSRVESVKRLDVLLEALRIEPRLADLRIDVLGSGGLFHALAARARDAGRRIHFHGFRLDVLEFLRRADLLVHTCDTEPHGLGVAEAMAAGLPVLVPDQGGAASLVEPGRTGMRFRSGDPRALANAILELRGREPRWLHDLGVAARHAARERFAPENGGRRYRELVARQLSGTAPIHRPPIGSSSTSAHEATT